MLIVEYIGCMTVNYVENDHISALHTIKRRTFGQPKFTQRLRRAQALRCQVKCPYNARISALLGAHCCSCSNGIAVYTCS